MKFNRDLKTSKSRSSMRKRSIFILLYAIYVAFILVSTVPYLAEQETRGTLSGGVYESHLVFPADGVYGHYRNVVLDNKGIPGKIDLTYTFDTNTLNIEKCNNTVELTIDCKLMYENKCQEVFEKTTNELGAEYYKDYFINTNEGEFTINVNTDTEMTKLIFKNTPEPYSVTVESVEWWQPKTECSISGNDVTITKVPVGSSTVIINFQTPDNQLPTAAFTIAPVTQFVNQVVSFDASASSDTDGTISEYLWDFNDGSVPGSGVKTTHKYTTANTYHVTLKVRDDKNGEDTLTKDVNIIEEGAGEPPTADFTMPSKGEVGKDISFDASDSSDSDGTISSYSWDFGDDSTGTGETIKHKYTKAKSYNVELTVTDNDGLTAAKEKTIVISEVEEEEDDEDEGMFGLGKVAGIDVFLLLIIIIIIVIVIIGAAAAAASSKKKKKALEEEAAKLEAAPPSPEEAELPEEELPSEELPEEELPEEELPPEKSPEEPPAEEPPAETPPPEEQPPPG